MSKYTIKFRLKHRNVATEEIINLIQQCLEWQANTKQLSDANIYVDDDDTTVEWMACAADKFCQAIYYNWGSAVVATKHFSR